MCMLVSQVMAKIVTQEPVSEEISGHDNMDELKAEDIIVKVLSY